MAASLNYLNEGSKLNSGHKLIVTVDVFSENAIIVSGCVGSRKYKGALLGSQSEYVKPFTQESVFNWDYSLKNNFSQTNFSYKNLHTTDSSILPSKLLLGSSYICANCKMKISNSNPKTGNKSQTIESKNNIIHKSDIILLKQTLSYPEFSLDKAISTTSSNENQSLIKLLPSDIIPKKLKRKKLSNCNQSSAIKRKRLASPKDETVSPKSLKTEKLEERPIREGITLRNCKQTNDKYVAHRDSVKINDTSEVHENYRVMPQTLSRLNNISSVDSYQEMEEFFNREFPKPKKNWMKMIENEDNLKTHESNTLSCSIEFKDIDCKLETFVEESPLESGIKDSSIDPVNTDPILESIVTDSHPESTTVDSLQSGVKLSSLDTISQTSTYDLIPKDILPIVEYLSIESSIQTTNLESLSEYLTVEPSNKDFSLESIIGDLPLESINDNPSPELCSKDSVVETLIKYSDIDQINKDSNTESCSDITGPKNANQSKFSHFNRSYKIKQSLHDKVILTVERGSFNSVVHNVPLINDIYSFTDDDDNSMDSPVPNNYVIASTQLSVPLSDGDNVLVNCSNENNKTESIKSLKTNNSKRSKISKKYSPNKIDKKVFEQKLKLESKVENVESVQLVSSCENSGGTLFKLDDVVWAKITGYPYWPARIMSFSIEDDSFISCIEWYAWKEVSFIKVNNLFHFKEFYQTKYQRKKRNSKYQEAVKLARNCCGMLEAQDNPPSDDLGTLCSTKDSDSDSESNEGSVTSAS